MRRRENARTDAGGGSSGVCDDGARPASGVPERWDAAPVRPKKPADPNPAQDDLAKYAPARTAG